MREFGKRKMKINIIKTYYNLINSLCMPPYHHLPEYSVFIGPHVWRDENKPYFYVSENIWR